MQIKWVCFVLSYCIFLLSYLATTQAGSTKPQRMCNSSLECNDQNVKNKWLRMRQE